MARMSRRVTAVLSVAILLWAGAAWAGHEDGRVLVVAPPLARADALWMAAARGFFKDEGLSVTVRWVSSGREAYATRALQKNGDAVHRLATAKGYAHGYLVLGASRQYLREHAGVAERLLRALDRGRRHAAEHRDDVIAFARDMFGTEPAVVDIDYAATERLLGVNPTVVSDMRNLVHWMKEAGLLGAPADPRTLFELGPLRATFPERLAADD